MSILYSIKIGNTYKRKNSQDSEKKTVWSKYTEPGNSIAEYTKSFNDFYVFAYDSNSTLSTLFQSLFCWILLSCVLRPECWLQSPECRAPSAQSWLLTTSNALVYKPLNVLSLRWLGFSCFRPIITRDLCFYLSTKFTRQRAKNIVTHTLNWL